MSIVSRKFDRKELGAAFHHAATGKILCSLDAKQSLLIGGLIPSGVSRRRARL